MNEQRISLDVIYRAMCKIDTAVSSKLHAAKIADERHRWRKTAKVRTTAPPFQRSTLRAKRKSDTASLGNCGQGGIDGISMVSAPCHRPDE
jgi:hypothetical protein